MFADCVVVHNNGYTNESRTSKFYFSEFQPMSAFSKMLHQVREALSSLNSHLKLGNALYIPRLR